MKLKIKSEEIQKIENLLNIKEINIALADMLFSFFTKQKYYPAKDLDEYLQQMINYWQLDMNNEQNVFLIEKCIRQTLKELNPTIILENDYFKNIKIGNIKQGKYELSWETYRPYQAFSYADIDVVEDFLEIQKVGYFNKEISYPVLKHDNIVWMSITPNEITTMQEAIKEARGNVLVLGLGLGYYQYMVSNKDSVKKVTIIEKDENIIQLFKKHILPQFKNKQKIKIIHDDAFHFLDCNKEKFDYCFLDLWHSPEDGFPLFLRLRNYEQKYKNTTFNYWLNKSILAMYRRCYLTLIQENLMGFDDKNYQKSKNIYDQIINDLYFKTKEKSVCSYEEIYNLLTDENLRNN